MACKKTLRITCRIPCEISYGKQLKTATVVDVSERGMGIESDIRVGEGEAVRVTLYPHRADRSIEVQAIIWNERTIMKSRNRGASHVLGLMLSDTPDRFLALIEKLGARDHDSRAVAAPQRLASASSVIEDPSAGDPSREEALRIIQEPPSDSALPRPMSPLPPPKASEEESLPLFRARIKQVDGPRTLRVEIRALSVSDVEFRVQQQLDGEWEVLDVRWIGPKGLAGRA